MIKLGQNAIFLSILRLNLSFKWQIRSSLSSILIYKVITIIFNSKVKEKGMILKLWLSAYSKYMDFQVEVSVFSVILVFFKMLKGARVASFSFLISRYERCVKTTEKVWGYHILGFQALLPDYTWLRQTQPKLRFPSKGQLEINE